MFKGEKGKMANINRQREGERESEGDRGNM